MFIILVGCDSPLIFLWPIGPGIWGVYHVRGIATRGGCMAVRVLLMLAAYAVLYGCGQASFRAHAALVISVSWCKINEPREITISDTALKA
jgi:hypothetical protein